MMKHVIYISYLSIFILFVESAVLNQQLLVHGRKQEVTSEAAVKRTLVSNAIELR